MAVRTENNVSLVSSATLGGPWATETCVKIPIKNAKHEYRKPKTREPPQGRRVCFSLRASRQRVKQREAMRYQPGLMAVVDLYPRTLILEKDSTARPVVGRPMDVAGRNVVKISMFLTWGSNSLDCTESDRMR